MDDLFSLAGQHALVTGGSRGIGLAIAKAFATAGASVTICSRKKENVDNAVASIRDASGDADGVVGNVGKPDEIERIAEEAEARFGPVSILVNNAGTNRFMGPIEEISEADWDHTLGVNLKGPMLLSQRIGKGMIQAGGGSILHIASTAGLQAAPQMGAYSVSKAGLVMLTKVLAREWGRFGVRVNCICPGLVRTDLSEALWSDSTRLASIVAAKALRRIGEPHELVGAALYLVSEAGAFTTGAILRVDGGMVM